MDSRLFFLRGRLRKGSRFLRGARVYRRAAPAAFPVAISISRGKGLSSRRGSSELPAGVQHASAFRAPASEFALPVLLAALRSAPQVSELVAKLQMTLKEKIGQMTQLAIGMVTDGKDQSIRINPEKLHKAVGEYGVGSILNVNDEALSPEKWHEIIRAIHAEAKKSRLQIPVLYGIDTIHGPHYVVGSTLFPQPLALAATWNPELMLRGTQIASAETRKAGIPWSFSPVLDAGGQPLWSPLWEPSGEATHLP